jgi:hypothetical protein
MPSIVRALNVQYFSGVEGQWTLSGDLQYLKKEVFIPEM